MRWSKWFCISLMFCFLNLPVSSGNRVKVPEPLKPWVDWVLHDQEKQLNGIPVYNNSSKVVCVWPTELTLDVNDSGATFTQNCHMNCESWIALPGSDPHWPVNVRIDGRPAITIKISNHTVLKANIGNHRITGEFRWNELPENLTVPRETALISLTVNDKNIEFPRMDKQGRLWFQVQRNVEETIENRLSIQEFRLINDLIPAMMTIHLKLDVAGTARQIILGPVFDTDRFTPLELNSPIPARIDQDGQLIVQLTPGKWTLELTLRHLGPLESLMFKLPEDDYWPHESIWSFKSQNHLRIVEIENVVSIDPKQTSMPPKWREFPAYLMKPGDTMKYLEVKRGNPKPAPDQLNLDRTLWLRFDGSGYTIQDKITGTKNNNWRLEMNPSVKLGKVEVNGAIQFITQRDGTESTGVELRMGSLQLNADSEYTETITTIPQTGWNQNFQSVTTRLWLPPGYRLFHAFGMDNVPNTWLMKWNLLELFFVLLLTAAVFRLFTRKLSFLALITLVLLYHEPGAPRWIWLAVVVGAALLKYLPESKFKLLIKIYQIIVVAILVIISTTFAVNHLRVGIFPQLAEHGRYQRAVAPEYDKMSAEAPRLAGGVSFAETVVVDGASSMNEQRQKLGTKKSYSIRSQVAQYDPTMQNQTGPGLPEWNWQAIYMSSGPAIPGQKMTFILTGPKVNLALAFIRVILMIFLAAGLFGISYRKKTGWKLQIVRWFVPTILFVSLLLLPNSVSAGEIPSQNMLNELQKRLLEKDNCFPYCADVLDISIKLSPQEMEMLINVSCQIDTVIPLPCNEKQWLPRKIYLDQKTVTAMIRSDDKFWVMVPEGLHQLRLLGKLPPYNTVQLPLPMKPARVNVDARGWIVSGIRDNGFIDNHLQFNRIKTEETKSEDTMETAVMPHFVQVERTLLLGMDWRVATRIVRKTPLDSAIVLKIPLLTGESVITEGIEVKNGYALVNLDVTRQQIEWESILEPSDEILLKHSDTNLWTEVWQVDVSPILHLEYQGIPMIMQKQGDRWFPRWHPWPEEEVTLTITRPKGVVGQTFTIQKSVLEVTPSKRVTECTLNLTIQSSQGLQHNIVLPEDVQVQEMRINNRSQPVRQDGRNVPLSISPGKQVFMIKWLENRGASLNFKTPEINLGIRNVNTTIIIRFHSNRWPLWLSGPQLGPALLFWSILIVMLIAAFILSKTGMTPLKFRHWFFLALGMSQGGLVGIFIVLVWLIAIHFRGKVKKDMNSKLFDMMQIGIVFLSGIAVIALIVSISSGLLGRPDMGIAGNGSFQSYFAWYQDCSGNILPIAGVISIPIFFYRIAMLMWALWTAFYLIEILKWAWKNFSQPVFWKKFLKQKNRIKS
ncbi:hypothetical protein K8T06_12315 [bacterium]|nr:hypothetical protein [bacterium]